jgi:hypothetical protein
VHLNSLDHPDMSLGGWLEQMVEDDLAQGDRAFGHPAPPVIHRGDGEGAAKVAALLCPAGDTGLKRAIELSDLFADIPLRPACHVRPHLPDLGWLGLERRLALKQLHISRLQ